MCLITNTQQDVIVGILEYIEFKESEMFECKQFFWFQKLFTVTNTLHAKKLR